MFWIESSKSCKTFSKDIVHDLLLAIHDIYLLAGQVSCSIDIFKTWQKNFNSMAIRDIYKMNPTSCANMPHGVTFSGVDWEIFKKMNISGIEHDFCIKIILKLCLKHYIFRSYHF